MKENCGLDAQQAALDAVGKMMGTQVRDRLEKLIIELHEFVKPRSQNVYKEIKSKMVAIRRTYNSLNNKETTPRGKLSYAKSLEGHMDSTSTRTLMGTSG